MLTYLLTVTLLIFVYYFTYRLKRARFEKLVDQFKGFPAYPIFGNSLTMTAVSFAADSWDFLRNVFLHRQFDSPTRIWFFNVPFIIIYDPENIQIVSNKTLSKGREIKFVRPVYGNSLETINDVEMWKKRRRLLKPVVSSTLKDRYLTVFNKFNRNLVRELSSYADTGQKIDLWRHIHNMEYRKSVAIFMDYDDEVEQEKLIDFTIFPDQVLCGLKYVVWSMFIPWLHIGMVTYIYHCISGKNKLFQDIRIPLVKIMKKHIATKMDENDDSDSNKSSLIHILAGAEASEQYSEEEKIDEIMTFLIGATETTSSNTCFTLLMLAMHQNYQDQVYEEIHRILGPDGDKMAELEELNQLVFLEQCMKESSRLFPVPNVMRESKEDLVLKDGRIIPGGVTVILSIGALHRNPRIYPDPGVYDPSRFTPEEIAKRHPCSFIPLSTGPRNCIAAKIGSLSEKCQLTALLRRYKFTTDAKMSDLHLSFDIKTRNIGGFPVYITRRKKVD